MRDTPLRLILAIIHAMAIIIGIYAVLTLWDWVPSFKSLFDDELIHCEKFTKWILFGCVPVGIALFCNQMTFGDSLPAKIATGVGLAVMVVPALIFHIEIIDAVASEKFYAFCTANEHSVNKQYIGLMLIFPIICLYLVTTFQLVGKDQYIIHENYDDALDNAGFILPYLYTCFGIGAVTLFIGTMGDLKFYSFFSMIVGFVALAVMGISRLKNGSPFEY